MEDKKTGVFHSTRAPEGNCGTMPADGEGVFWSPAICQITGPILDLKTESNSNRHTLSKYIASYYLNVTDNVTSQVKG